MDGGLVNIVFFAMYFPAPCRCLSIEWSTHDDDGGFEAKLGKEPVVNLDQDSVKWTSSCCCCSMCECIMMKFEGIKGHIVSHCPNTSSINIYRVSCHYVTLRPDMMNWSFFRPPQPTWYSNFLFLQSFTSSRAEGWRKRFPLRWYHYRLTCVYNWAYLFTFYIRSAAGCVDAA